MDHDHEIRSLAAETMALTTVLGFVLQRLSVRNKSEISQAFEEAANHVTGIALRGVGSPEHTTKALKIIDQLRQTALG